MKVEKHKSPPLWELFVTPSGGSSNFLKELLFILNTSLIKCSNLHHNDKGINSSPPINRSKTIFDQVRSLTNIKDSSYMMFGHSAGSQFVHRMVLFLPEARISRAFAANAGWHTIPNSTVKFPYGIKNTSIDQNALVRSYSKNLIILLGEDDTDDEHLRETEKANAQGNTRGVATDSSEPEIFICK